MAKKKKLTYEEFEQEMIKAIRETDKNYVPPTEKHQPKNVKLTQEELEVLVEIADSLDDEK